MGKRRKSNFGPPYPRPPIFECAMEIRFRDQPRVDFVAKAARLISQQYDHSHTDQLVNIEVQVVDGNVNSKTSSPAPVTRLTSNDQADICTIAGDRLHWSRLAPYMGWDHFENRFARDISIVKRLISRRHLQRVGLRYQNRIDVPVEGQQQICRFENYFRIKIDLPSLFDPTDSFEWRVAKEFPDLGLAAQIRSGVMEPVVPMMGAFLLDIDVSASVDVQMSRADLSCTLAKMRELKNQIFEHSITDLARESFR